MKIEVTGSIGLALISLYHWKAKDSVILFSIERLQEIRKAVIGFYAGHMVGEHIYRNVGCKIDFEKSELETLEKHLPFYGIGYE